MKLFFCAQLSPWYVDRCFKRLTMVTLVCLVCLTSALAQSGYVEVVRKGVQKTAEVYHGTYVKIRLKNGERVKGFVNEVLPKSLELSSRSVDYRTIASIELPNRTKKVFKNIGMYTTLGGLTLALSSTELIHVVLAAVPVCVGGVVWLVSAALPSKYYMNRGWYLKVHPDKPAKRGVEGE